MPRILTTCHTFLSSEHEVHLNDKSLRSKDNYKRNAINIPIILSYIQYYYLMFVVIFA